MVTLTCVGDGVGKVFSPEDTEGFLTVAPCKKTHQIFLCKETKNMILFVPSIEHQNSKFSMDHNEVLRNLLLKSFRGVVKILEQKEVLLARQAQQGNNILVIYNSDVIKKRPPPLILKMDFFCQAWLSPSCGLQSSWLSFSTPHH